MPAVGPGKAQYRSTDGCQHYEMESDYEQGEILHYYLDRLEGFVPYGDRISPE